MLYAIYKILRVIMMYVEIDVKQQVFFTSWDTISITP